MEAEFTINSTASSRKLTFSELEGEYFRVSLQGDVTASIGVYAYTDASGIATLFKDLARYDKPWSGKRGWESIESDFVLNVSCSHLGQVLIEIQLSHAQPQPEAWDLNIGIETEFGQLQQIAKNAEAFFK